MAQATTTSTAMEPVLSQLAVPGIEVSYTALRVTDPDLAYEDFERAVRAAGQFKTASSWWLGDLLNFGERLYDHDRYVDAMEKTGLAYETLTNYAYVCRRLARSRRRDQLRFGHHAEVAALEPAQQTEWLDAAQARDWTTADLRRAIRDARQTPEREQPQWTRPEPRVLTSSEAAEAAARAETTLRRPLPEGHPLWPTQARAAAEDVLSLALTVAERPDPRPLAVAVMEAAVVEGDGYRVPRGPLDALLRAVLEGEG